MLVSLGFSKFDTLGAAKGLHQGSLGAIPDGAQFAIVSIEDQSVRWRADGTAPTATVGHLLTAGTYLWITSWLTKVEFIAATAGAKMTAEFFKQA